MTTPAPPGSAAATRLPSWGLWLTKPLRGLNHPEPLAFQDRGRQALPLAGLVKNQQRAGGWEGDRHPARGGNARELCAHGLPRAEQTLRVGAEELI